MPNDIEISRLEKAKRELAMIENATLTSVEDAAKAVGILVASYPQTPPAEPDVYMRQLRGLLSSFPTNAIETLVDPLRGILTQCKFLPSIAEVYEWLEKFQEPDRRMAVRLRDHITMLEHAPLPSSEPAPPPLSVRRKQIEDIPPGLRKPEKLRIKDLDWLKPLEQQDPVERRVNERFAKTQRSVPELAMQALKNLEDMR